VGSDHAKNLHHLTRAASLPPFLPEVPSLEGLGFYSLRSAIQSPFLHPLGASLPITAPHSFFSSEVFESPSIKKYKDDVAIPFFPFVFNNFFLGIGQYPFASQ